MIQKNSLIKKGAVISVIVNENVALQIKEAEANILEAKVKEIHSNEGLSEGTSVNIIFENPEEVANDNQKEGEKS